MKEITSTMAGTILQVNVANGDEVGAGQVVIVLESMKMEIPIESPLSGKVSEVKVTIGDFVNEDDSLIIFE